MNGNNGKVWTRSMSNEIGRLAQGNQDGVTATDTISFIPRKLVLRGRKCTYGNFVCDYKKLNYNPIALA